MFIKSLFQSENIPYYIEFENISRMRPGMYIGDLGNYNLVYILEKDYHDALKIVKKYIQGKKRSKINKNNKTENIRNFAEVLFANWAVPSSNAVSGIEILYKK
jgi:DNA gyrase/topoisomerase IV subunit B